MTATYRVDRDARGATDMCRLSDWRAALVSPASEKVVMAGIVSPGHIEILSRSEATGHAIQWVAGFDSSVVATAASQGNRAGHLFVWNSYRMGSPIWETPIARITGPCAMPTNIQVVLAVRGGLILTDLTGTELDFIATRGSCQALATGRSLVYCAHPQTVEVFSTANDDLQIVDVFQVEHARSIVAMDVLDGRLEVLTRQYRLTLDAATGEVEGRVSLHGRDPLDVALLAQDEAYTAFGKLPADPSIDLAIPVGAAAGLDQVGTPGGIIHIVDGFPMYPVPPPTPTSVAADLSPSPLLACTPKSGRITTDLEVPEPPEVPVEVRIDTVNGSDWDGTSPVGAASYGPTQIEGVSTPAGGTATITGPEGDVEVIVLGDGPFTEYIPPLSEGESASFEVSNQGESVSVVVVGVPSYD